MIAQGRVVRDRPLRGTISEHELADFNQGNFMAQGSRGLSLIRDKFPDGFLSRRLLLSFATIISGLANRPLPRDLTRRQILLVKWLDEGYDILKPYAQFVSIDLE
jgi:hypothetical protein